MEYIIESAYKSEKPSYFVCINIRDGLPWYRFTRIRKEAKIFNSKKDAQNWIKNNNYTCSWIKVVAF